MWQLSCPLGRCPLQVLKWQWLPLFLFLHLVHPMVVVVSLDHNLQSLLFLATSCSSQGSVIHPLLGKQCLIFSTHCQCWILQMHQRVSCWRRWIIVHPNLNTLIQMTPLWGIILVSLKIQSLANSGLTSGLIGILLLFILTLSSPTLMSCTLRCQARISVSKQGTMKK